MKQRIHNQSGMTLIEILISLSLMAVMFLMMNETMNDISWSRNKVQNQSEENHTLYVAFSLLYDDINMAFLADESFEGKTNPQVTGFIGGSEKLYFSTLSGKHFVKDRKDTDTHNVGFFLRDNSDGTKSLMRSSSPSLSDDLEKELPGFEVLARVKTLNLEYYDSNKKDWQSQWDTNKTAYAGRLPEMVKVSLEIYGQPVSDDSDEKIESSYEWIMPIEMFKTKISF